VELTIRNQVMANIIDSETKLAMHKYDKEQELSSHRNALEEETEPKRAFTNV